MDGKYAALNTVLQNRVEAKVVLTFDELDEIVDVWDGDAILMAQELARHGLAVGISSGANFLGALELASTLGTTAVVATVFADSNKKYLSTDLFRKEPIRPEYLSTEVSDIRWRAMGYERS